MQVFRAAEHSIFVNIHAVEVYLPYDYLDKAYRGANYYSVVGTKVNYYGVGNMRFYQTAKEMDNPLGEKVYTLGIPMIVSSEPTEIDTRDVQFTKGGPIRKCIVLTFYKDDMFIVNTELMQVLSNVMIFLTRIYGGKLDHLPPEDTVKIFQDVQSMNGIKLRIPSEEEEIFISELYRSERNPNLKARHVVNVEPDQLVSYNMRQEAMKSTTYQALTHEDINTSLITSINRAESGKVDQPTAIERIVRSMDVSDLEADRDRRLEAEKQLFEQK